MKYLDEVLHQILLGCDYEMSVNSGLITITLASYISDWELSKVMEAVHRRQCIMFVYPKDEDHIELSISEK
jgi:hypothetical protein